MHSESDHIGELGHLLDKGFSLQDYQTSQTLELLSKINQKQIDIVVCINEKPSNSDSEHLRFLHLLGYVDKLFQYIQGNSSLGGDSRVLRFHTLTKRRLEQLLGEIEDRCYVRAKLQRHHPDIM